MMKIKLSKKEALNKIEDFFKREDFNDKEVKRIKRLAMKFNIKLGKCRERFCKKCLKQLKGKTKVGKTWKSVVCGSCGYKNRIKLFQ